MSESLSLEPPAESSLAFTIASQMVYHTIVQPKAGSKAQPKDKKVTKSKEFEHVFATTSSNYGTLLKLILMKHGEEKYNFTGRKPFPFKILCPPAKAKTNAIDIDNYQDFQDLVKKLNNNAGPSRSTRVTIYHDMQNIQKAWRNSKSTGGSGSGDEEDQDDKLEEGTNGTSGLSEMEFSLACFRILIEKQHTNDHDAGYTYVNDGMRNGGDVYSIPLTPLMIKEWARWMYDGKATALDPPAIEMFDPVKRRPTLHPSRTPSFKATGPSSTPPSLSLSDIALSSLASIMSAFTGGSSFVHGTLVPAPNLPITGATVGSTPVTPTRNCITTTNTAESPPIPSPSQLPRFLIHAEHKLGVTNATSHQFSLASKGYGPDVIHHLDNLALVELGFTPGDAIRLKAGSIKWWNGPNAKRKHDSDNDRGTGMPSANRPRASPEEVVPPNEAMQYERHYTDGGACTFWEPVLAPGDQTDSDRETMYLCPIRREMLPIPLGFVVGVSLEDDVFS